jgi:acetyl-CoA C-acetyltransferase
MSVAANTPILVGVGEFSERLEANDYRGLSPAALAAEAARVACDDALSVERLAKHIDIVAAIRQFEISTPRAKAPFGRSNNFPRSVAERIGANPQRAILEVTGGQGPQHLVNEIAGLIAAGKARCTLLVGAEAISTARRLASEESKPDWSETVDGPLEDRGYGLAGISTEYQQRRTFMSRLTVALWVTTPSRPFSRRVLSAGYPPWICRAGAISRHTVFLLH